MKNTLLLPELREYLATNKAAAIRSFCEEGHPAMVADLISSLKPDEVWRVLLHTSEERRAEIFAHLPTDIQVEVSSRLNRGELARLLTEMSPDDRVDLFKQFPEEHQEMILPALAQAEREDLRRLASFPEGTAGSVMTSDYATLLPDLTVAEAITRLRQEAPDKETIYYAYVIDENRKLLGLVSLKDLIIARSQALVKDIMEQDIVYVNADDDQEEAARKIEQYDLIALPVVNRDGMLIGIITHDDAFDIIVQEQTEDIEKLMAIGGAHEPRVYLSTSAWEHFRNRFGWIIALGLLGLVSGLIVQHYEALLLQISIIATFIPMLADTGGNTGSQSSTLVIRALAINEITPRDILRVLIKETKVSLMLAALLAILAYGRVVLFSGGAVLPPDVSLTTLGLAVALALALQVITATLIGALLPLIASRLRIDPAVVASPALTTIVDITGLLIFFTTVRVMIG